MSGAMYAYKGSKSFILTYTLVAVNIAFYIYTSIVGGSFISTSDEVLVFYGQANWLVLRGWYWQLFTAMFVHVNLVHLFGNMFFLIVFGLRAEELFGIMEYLTIYFSSGLAGNLLTLLFEPYTISAGASGAIFGLFGACTIFLRRTLGQSILGALLYSFFLLTLFSISPNVNFLAHFGGLAVGLLAGYIFAVRREKRVVYSYNVSYG
jgi:rhomboid protease GluP